jgi:uncharacterized protein (TIGR02145 family)
MGMIEEIQIGTQIWMSTNLDVSHYKNGDPILEVIDAQKWKNAIGGACCFYNNDSANNKKYGTLYNANAVIDDRGLAPEGWHIPTNEEWDLLESHLGKMNAGIRLKSASGWAENGNGDHCCGFNALPAGSRNAWGDFDELEYATYFWSYTTSLTGIFYRYITYDLPILQQWNDDGMAGFSVRCIKD